MSGVFPVYFFPPIAIISGQSICHTEGGHLNERGKKHTQEPHICQVLFSTLNKQYFITTSTVYHGNDFLIWKVIKQKLRQGEYVPKYWAGSAEDGTWAWSFFPPGGGLVAKSCLTLVTTWTVACPASSVHGILQARMLKWVVISFSRGSSWPRNRTWVSCMADRFFTHWVTREAFLSL